MDEYDPDRKNTLGTKELKTMSIAEIKRQNPYHIQKSVLKTKGDEGFFSFKQNKQDEIVKLIRERADASLKTPAKFHHTKNQTAKRRLAYITGKREKQEKDGEEAEKEFKTRQQQQGRTLPTVPRHSVTIRKNTYTPTVQDMIANHKTPTFEELGGPSDEAVKYYTFIMQKEKNDPDKIVFAAQQLEKANRAVSGKRGGRKKTRKTKTKTKHRKSSSR